MSARMAWLAWKAAFRSDLQGARRWRYRMEQGPVEQELGEATSPPDEHIGAPERLPPTLREALQSRLRWLTVRVGRLSGGGRHLTRAVIYARGRRSLRVADESHHATATQPTAHTA